MYDVICIGGATQDIFFIDPTLPIKGNDLALEWGEKFLVKDCLISFGGGASNSAVGLSRLGFKVAFWGHVGEDLPGEEIARNFKKEGVGLEFLKIENTCKTSISAVMVGLGGEHSIVMFRGKNDDLEEEAAKLETEISDTKFFHLSDVGSTSEVFTAAVINLVKKHGIKLAFVPGQNQLHLGLNKLAMVLQNTELFVLNVYEAYELLGWPFEKSNLNDCSLINKKVEEALLSFSKLGARKVIITRDVCGSQGYDGVKYYNETAPIVPVKVNTTGAGDAFATGAVAALLKGHDLGVALNWGNQESGAVLGQLGAQPGLLRELAT